MSPPAKPLVSERLLAGVGTHDGDIDLLEDGLELPGSHEGVLTPAGDPTPGAWHRELTNERRVLGHVISEGQ